MKTKTTPIILPLVLCVVSASLANAVQTPQFKIIDLGVAFTISTTGGKDINNLDQVLFRGDGGKSYLWDDGIIVDPPGVVAGGNSANAVNDASVFLVNENRRPVVWDGTTRLELPALSNDTTFGSDLNLAGHVVGYSRVNGNRHGFLWDGTQMMDLGVPSIPNGSSEANAISDTGLIVGVAGAGDHAPAKWVSGEWIELVNPFQTSRYFGAANDVNDAGQIVGNARDENSRNHAVIWDTDGTPTVISEFGSLDSGNAYGMNATGDVVGAFFSVGSSSADRAFLRRNSQTYDLTGILGNPDWSLSRAWAINDRGAIAGVGRYLGISHGFLLEPIPEPTTCTLALAVLCLAASSLRVR